MQWWEERREEIQPRINMEMAAILGQNNKEIDLVLVIFHKFNLNLKCNSPYPHHNIRQLHIFSYNLTPPAHLSPVVHSVSEQVLTVHCSTAALQHCSAPRDESKVQCRVWSSLLTPRRECGRAVLFVTQLFHILQLDVPKLSVHLFWTRKHIWGAFAKKLWLISVVQIWYETKSCQDV